MIDLKPFCGEKESAYIKTEPFALHGFLYATDCRIVVRIPTKLPDSPHSFPYVETALPWNLCQLAKTPYAPAGETISREITCKTCEGTGVVDAEECEDCDGCGTSCCTKCGNEDDCEECDGKGRFGGTECPVCHGAKRIIGPYLRPLAGSFIKLDYDRKIAELPNVMIGECDGGKIPFIFDGGEGFVMACTKD